MQGYAEKKNSDGVSNSYSGYTPDAYLKILKFDIGVSFYNKNLAGGVNSRPSIIHLPFISLYKSSTKLEHHNPFTIATRNIG